VKRCKKAVNHRKNSERPQNRNLRPWKKGQAPKSPGRPRTAHILAELEHFLYEHPDLLDAYLTERVAGKMRAFRIMDKLMEKNITAFCYLIWGKPR
jgi:hypothetical protein